MEENHNIFLAGGAALVYLTGPMHKKYLFVAIHLVRTYLMTNFSTPPPPFTHMYAFRVNPFLRM